MGGAAGERQAKSTRQCARSNRGRTRREPQAGPTGALHGQASPGGWAPSSGAGQYIPCSPTTGGGAEDATARRARVGSDARARDTRTRVGDTERHRPRRGGDVATVLGRSGRGSYVNGPVVGGEPEHSRQRGGAKEGEEEKITGRRRWAKPGHALGQGRSASQRCDERRADERTRWQDRVVREESEKDLTTERGSERTGDVPGDRGRGTTERRRPADGGVDCEGAVSLRIGASLDLETVLREVVESACALTGAHYGAIANARVPTSRPWSRPRRSASLCSMRRPASRCRSTARRSASWRACARRAAPRRICWGC